jgi:hypothetical protein
MKRDHIAIAKKAARTRKRMQQARTVSDAITQKEKRRTAITRLLPCPDYSARR